MVYDPRKVSVRVGDYEIPNIQEIDPDYGETVEPVSSAQGFVDHQIKPAPATCRIKFRAEPGDSTVEGLLGYFRNKSQFTVTIITPDYKTTFTGARMHAYPKRVASIEGLAEFDIEFSGRSAGPRND